MNVDCLIHLFHRDSCNFPCRLMSATASWSWTLKCATSESRRGRASTWRSRTWVPASRWSPSASSTKPAHSLSATWPRFPTRSLGLTPPLWWRSEAPVSTNRRRERSQRCIAARTGNGWFLLVDATAAQGIRSGVARVKVSEHNCGHCGLLLGWPVLQITKDPK